MKNASVAHRDGQAGYEAHEGLGENPWGGGHARPRKEWQEGWLESLDASDDCERFKVDCHREAASNRALWDSEDTPHMRGYAAFEANEGLSVNPYGRGARREWQSGWISAMKDSDMPAHGKSYCITTAKQNLKLWDEAEADIPWKAPEPVEAVQPVKSVYAPLFPPRTIVKIIVEESRSQFKQMRKESCHCEMSTEIKTLFEEHVGMLEDLGTYEQVDAWLRNYRRMSLKEWVESL